MIGAAGAAKLAIANAGSFKSLEDTFLSTIEALAKRQALVERGTCGFAVKARNATNAGATGVIIYNNTTGMINMIGGECDK